MLVNGDEKDRIDGYTPTDIDDDEEGFSDSFDVDEETKEEDRRTIFLPILKDEAFSTILFSLDRSSTNTVDLMALFIFA